MKRANVIWQEKKSVRAQMGTIKMTKGRKKSVYSRECKRIFSEFFSIIINIRSIKSPSPLVLLLEISRSIRFVCASFISNIGGETSKWIGYPYPINMQYVRYIRYIYKKR